ncbi:hypothetical protein MAR_021826 [Mya arenaria]|uniref:Uncharacterized protein n=1 Tax=Mya arenaria TaxID=6604 RepID=A0ABY7E8X1_MYAAR|nr:hypothetical protein MAR_021826 [Mya arenaria]
MQIPVPDYISYIDSVFAEYQYTPIEQEISNIKEKIGLDDTKFFYWMSDQFLHVKSISDEQFPDTEKAQQKQITFFCTKLNSYLKSDLYIQGCKDLLVHYDTSQSKYGQMFCTSVLFQIQSLEIKHKATLVQSPDIQERAIPSGKSEDGRGNLRYVGGYCVQSSLYDPKKAVRLNSSRQKVSYLNYLSDSFANLSSSSKHADTLNATAKKQNKRQSLTNLSDNSFEFFEQLNKKNRDLETFENLHTHGEFVIENVKSKINYDV